MKSLEERFWAKVQKPDDPDGCWEWTGATNGHGYGRFNGDYTHRIAYRLLVGPIPEGLTIDHLCRNRGCCNPSHMEPVTAAVNTLRGNSLSAQRARQTHCKRGHPLSGDNLYISGGKRTCRTCREEYRLAHWEEIKAHKRSKTLAANGGVRKNNRGERNGNAKLSWPIVTEMRQLDADGVPGSIIAEKFGVSRATVCLIVNGKRWSQHPAPRPSRATGPGAAAVQE